MAASAASGGSLACPIEPPDPTLNWEFPIPIFQDFYPPAEQLDKTACDSFESTCLHKTVAVAALPRALAHALGGAVLARKITLAALTATSREHQTCASYDQDEKRPAPPRICLGFAQKLVSSRDEEATGCG